MNDADHLGQQFGNYIITEFISGGDVWQRLQGQTCIF